MASKMTDTGLGLIGCGCLLCLVPFGLVLLLVILGVLTGVN